MKKHLLSVMLFTFFQTFSQLPQGYLSHYNFSGNLNDIVNNKPMTGAVSGIQYSNDRNSNPNQSILVNGSLLNAYDFDTTFDQLTFSFWFFKGQGNETILEAINANSGFRFYSSGTNLGIFVGNGNSSQVYLNNLPTLFDSTWHHIVLTFDSTVGSRGDISVYIDGNFNQTFSSLLDLNTGTNMFSSTKNATLKISPVQSTNNAFNDGLDDIFIYNRKLSAQEVTNLYNTRVNSKKIFVDRNANGSNDGSSWSNAYTDLNNALYNSIYNDTIWIAKGTYTPKNISNNSTNREDSFEIAHPKLTLYGGFSGTESSLADRDYSLIHTTNETILSGDLNGNDNANITFNNTTKTDNSYRVVAVTKRDVTIDGITIANGYANGDNNSGEQRFGAGLSIGQTSNFFTTDIIIRNSVIKNNVSYWAAGLYLPTFLSNNGGNSSIKIDACIFENNLSSLGGSAFYILPLTSTSVEIEITNCLFNNNKTEDDSTYNRNALGAPAGWIRAFYNNSLVYAIISNNTFVNNISNGSGTSTFPTFSVDANDGTYSNLILANNIFWGNKTNGNSISTSIKEVTGNITNLGFAIYNSIDEDGFSTTPNTQNTSSNNPNLTSTFKLQSNSTSAIDFGDNTKLPNTITRDLNGMDRFYNTTIDIGAFEFNPTLSVDKFKAETIFTYPNPTDGIVFIKSENEIKKVTVLNLLGKKLKETNSTLLDISSFSKGIYFINIEDKSGASETKRIIKK